LLVDPESNDLVAQSPLLFYGYYTSSNGFEPAAEKFLTGDIGTLDSDAYLWLKGRSNDTFKVSGKKVNRKVVENVLVPLLSGFSYCVLPVPHELLGTCCALFVESDKEPVPLKDIINQIKTELTSTCVPVYSYLLDSLPQLENGKLDKQSLIKNHNNFKRYQ
jgi:acyl-coenzyme A synthetase/AMP-(fatty) acid ligase